MNPKLPHVVAKMLYCDNGSVMTLSRQQIDRLVLYLKEQQITSNKKQKQKTSPVRSKKFILK